MWFLGFPRPFFPFSGFGLKYRLDLHIPNCLICSGNFIDWCCLLLYCFSFADFCIATVYNCYCFYAFSSLFVCSHASEALPTLKSIERLISCVSYLP